MKTPDPLPAASAAGDCANPQGLELSDGAVLAVLLLTRGVRLVVVPLVALVLTLAGWRPRRIFQPQPVVARTAPLTVQRLRWLVRQQYGPTCRPGGRRIAQARKADLLATLYVEAA